MIYNNDLNVKNEHYIGRVLGYNKSNRTVDVYLPRLMTGLNGTEIHKNKLQLNKNNIVNIGDLNLSDYIVKSNVLNVKPEDYSESLPDVNSLVIINSYLQNPLDFTYRKFNPNNDYNVIEEEKYPKQYSLTIGTKSIDVNYLDNIIINIPDDYKIILKENDKTKTIDIIENNDIENSLSFIKESVLTLNSNMNYLIKNEKETVKDTIDGIYNMIDLVTSDHYDLNLLNSTKETIKTQILKDSNEIDEINSFDKLFKIQKMYNLKSSALNYLTQDYDELYDYYKNYCINNNIEVEDDKYDLSLKETFNDIVLLDECKNQINNIFENINKYEDIEKFRTNLNKIRDLLSVNKTIKFYYDNNLIKTYSNNLFNNIEFPTDNLLLDYMIENDDYSNNDMYYTICGYHTDTDKNNLYIKDKIETNENLYIDVFKYKDEIGAVLDTNSNKYQIGIIDISEYPKYKNYQTKIYFNNIELDREVDNETGNYIDELPTYVKSNISSSTTQFTEKVEIFDNDILVLTFEKIINIEDILLEN